MVSSEIFVDDSGKFISMLALGSEVAKNILACDVAGDGNQCAAYILSEAKKYETLDPANAEPMTDGAVFDALMLLNDHWKSIAAGEMTGEALLSESFGLWASLMRSWPMQMYADQVASFLKENAMLNGLVVELGAGVGSCSKLVAGEADCHCVVTDIHPLMLRRIKLQAEIVQYNFDHPGNWQEVSTFFAVNAVHCALDKVATLRELHRMLKSGGVVVLGESVPITNEEKGTPWPLSMFFGMFSGWWDRGGLLSRESWYEAFSLAGFQEWGSQKIIAGDYDLGGVVWARK